MELKKVIEKENNFIFNHGGILSITEFDQELNAIQIEKIKAFANENEVCYLGKINIYDKNIRNNIDNFDPLVKYEGQRVYNFEYDFMINTHDEEIINLLREYNRPEQNPSGKKIMGRIELIFKRIDDIKGICFNWV